MVLNINKNIKWHCRNNICFNNVLTMPLSNQPTNISYQRLNVASKQNNISIGLDEQLKTTTTSNQINRKENNTKKTKN